MMRDLRLHAERPNSCIGFVGMSRADSILNADYPLSSSQLLRTNSQMLTPLDIEDNPATPYSIPMAFLQAHYSTEDQLSCSL
jgi:hypothetical protein